MPGNRPGEPRPRIATLSNWLDASIAALLAALALPRYSLTTVFVVALVSSTLLPMASEPAVFGLVRLNPALFWPVMLAATLGSTLGGGITWLMGYGVERAWERMADAAPRERRALAWLERFGPRACLLAWLPVVGDPLCAVAGWLRLPLVPCLVYMAIGKFGRYLAYTLLLLRVFPEAHPNA